MKNNIKKYIIMVVIVFILGNVMQVNAGAKTNSSKEQNAGNSNITEQYNTTKISQTFDVKTIIPEIAVIVVATGVLLVCITNKS